MFCGGYNSGYAYVIGTTFSEDFPTTPLSFQPEDLENEYYTYDNQGLKDLYITKLSPDGQTLVYSTYLAGYKTDHASDIAIDASGNAYVVGQTLSADFPTAGTPIHTCGDVEHPAQATITKLSPDGSSLVYSTCLGAAWASGVAVDSSGSAYVAGFVSGDNLTTQNAYQSSSGGNSDAFIMKLSPDGASLIYSTYLGGSSGDWGNAIAIDVDGSAYVIGETLSTDFPVQNALQTTTADNLALPNYHRNELFITKLSADGSSLVYSTYLGGSGVDTGRAIAVDASGNAYVAGGTKSTNFPITQNALKATLTGSEDAFITKLNSDGTLVYSTYFGGDAYEKCNDIAIGPNNDVYIAGRTSSTNFPTQDALETEKSAQGWFGFLTKLSGVDFSLSYSTYVGADSSNNFVDGIALDSSGNVYMTGLARSNFPTTPNAFQTENNGTAEDAFVVKIHELPPQPDLVIQSAQRDSSNANALTARYHVVIANQGTAAPAGPFLIRINSIRWGVRGPKIFKKKNVLVLLPGESLGAGATLEKNYWIPQADKTEFIVDIGKNITESNEDNNSLTVPWQ